MVGKKFHVGVVSGEDGVFNVSKDVTVPASVKRNPPLRLASALAAMDVVLKGSWSPSLRYDSGDDLIFGSPSAGVCPIVPSHPRISRLLFAGARRLIVVQFCVMIVPFDRKSIRGDLSRHGAWVESVSPTK